MRPRAFLAIVTALVFVSAASGAAAGDKSTCPGHNPESDRRAAQEQRKLQLDRELLRMDGVFSQRLLTSLNERLRALRIGQLRGLERSAYHEAFARTRQCLRGGSHRTKDRGVDALCRAFTGFRCPFGDWTSTVSSCATLTPWPPRITHLGHDSDVWGALTNPFDRPSQCHLVVTAMDGRELARLPLAAVRGGSARLYRRSLPRMEGADSPTSAGIVCAWKKQEHLLAINLATYSGPLIDHPGQGGALPGTPLPPAPDLLPLW